jgi:hypothetical protein
MRLCMFHPVGHPMERGWVGRIDGDRVVHLAAQTLQSFFTGGGQAREHAEYLLAEVVLLAPVLHPPTVRIFESEDDFAFANANAILSPGAEVRVPGGATGLEVRLRTAAVIGGNEEAAGFTLLAEARAVGLPSPKDRDFALVLGPVVLTPDEWSPDLEWDWRAALAYAGANTTLRPGDTVAGPSRAESARLGSGDSFALAHEQLGTLSGEIVS